MKKIILTIEKTDNAVFGTVEYDDNLIVEQATTEEKLKSKMTKLLFDFHDLRAEEFEFEIIYE